MSTVVVMEQAIQKMVDAVAVAVTRMQVELEQQIKDLGEVLVYRWHQVIQVVAVAVLVHREQIPLGKMAAMAVQELTHQ